MKKLDAVQNLENKNDGGPKSLSVYNISDGSKLDESEIIDFVFPDGTHLVTAPDCEIVRPVCGAVDVHKKILMAAVAITDVKTLRATYYVKKFDTMNSSIIEMASWFKALNVHDVLMESTGKYWIPVFDIIETKGLKPVVTHPKYVKQIKGNKTDFRDAIHMANLFRMDLVIPSFVPPADIRNMRELCRYMIKLGYMRTGEKNRYQNSLTVSKIRIDSILSDPFGVTATSIMNYLLNTPREEVTNEEILKRVDRRVKATPEEIIQSIEGFEFSGVQKEKLLIVGQHIKQIDELVDLVENALNPYKEKYASHIKLLCTIPGISKASALYIISEIGVDMSVWRSADTLASWAGLSPAKNESANKKKSTKIGDGGHYLKPILVQCALAAIKSEKCKYFASKYTSIKMRRGHKKAIIAIARMMLVCIYEMLKNGEEFNPIDLTKTVAPKAKKVELTFDNTIAFLKDKGVSDDVLSLITAQCGNK